MIRLADQKPTITSRPIPLRTAKRKVDTLIREEENDPPRASQKFLKTRNGFKASTPAASTQPSAKPEPEASRPWMERFAPVSISELAVHKKKVDDVRSWIEGVVCGARRNQRLLLLKGPAGSGKTTTVQLLARVLGLRINEWRNPTGTMQSDEGFVSMSAQFEDFMLRSGTFGTLDLVGDGSLNPKSSHSSESEKRMILIEEFPNTFSRTSPALQSFRKAVQLYLESSAPSPSSFSKAPKPATPIVMIISETLLSTSTAAADSFTAHRLLGPEILGHHAVTTIEFRPIAPTIMAKGLNLVLEKEARASGGKKKNPGTALLKSIAEIGDIRNAISTLEFYSLGKGSSSFMPSLPLNKDAEGTTDVDIRSSTLDLFHAVGKVIYNKRTDPQAAQPPPHLPHLARPLKPPITPDALLTELGADTSTFVATVHENYVPSCKSFSAEDELDSLCACADTLSDADILSPDRWSGNGVGASAQALRQEDLSAYVAIAGVSFNLPYPVKRAEPHGGYRKGNANHILYPISLRVWRRVEEIGEMVEQVVARMKGNGEWGVGLSGDAGGDRVKPELILERLPYLAQIERGRQRKAGGFPSSMTDLSKVVMFGRGIREKGGDDDEDEPNGEQWTTDAPDDWRKPQKAGWVRSKGTVGKVTEKVDALVLDDDDIED
ncbi:hypothetical protein EJ06DRAFT_476887 [Trichodelitschia bisporula]|uniref:Checkpoint protein RAD24-like helical bundle domain-containing protein n=1 Tax=Trichodelitschia bisporula TaxID=703511 RepID=A0A6G1HXA3_9PEZI|nr:hypothetical protein EJ06DRAFT_476887 [Trichodelitschia bisporula]